MNNSISPIRKQGSARITRSGGQILYFAAEQTFEMPLFVVCGIMTRWLSGGIYERKNSHTFSVELVVAGDAEFVQDSRHHIVKPGQVFLVKKYKDNLFKTGPSGFLHKRAVVMDGIVLQVVLESLGLAAHDVITCRSPAVLINLMKKVNAALITNSIDAHWQLTTLAYSILVELGHSCWIERCPPEIFRAVTYMNTNLHRNLTLTDIAQASGLTMYHFSRRFNHYLSNSPLAYFRNKKISMARNLLKSSDLLVKEVAALLGYDDPFYFTAQFQKVCGVSPKKYREQNS